MARICTDSTEGLNHYCSARFPPVCCHSSRKWNKEHPEHTGKRAKWWEKRFIVFRATGSRELRLLLLSLDRFSVKFDFNAILPVLVSGLKVPSWLHQTHSLQHDPSGFSNQASLPPERRHACWWSPLQPPAHAQ